MSCRAVLPLLLALLSALLTSVPSAVGQGAAVPVYLSYTTYVDGELFVLGNTANTQACGYLELSCAVVDAASQSFNCSEVVRGTHYLYPKPGPNFLTRQTPFIAGALPLPSCGAGVLLPLHNDMAFGLEPDGCVHLYLSDGVVHAKPSPVTTRTANLLSFAYSSDVTAVPACPVYTPTYSTVVTYFTYIEGTPNAPDSGTSFCGTGALLCNQSGYADGTSESCTALLNGTLYKYSGQFATTQVLTLTPVNPLNWQCYGPESDSILPLAAGFSFYYTGADGLVGCQQLTVNTLNGAAGLIDLPNFVPDLSNEKDLVSFTYGSTPALAGSCPAPNIVGPPGQILQASVCFIFYATPGYLEYPWSSAIKLSVYYDSTPIGSGGAAVQLLNVTGTRTFTNKYGSSFTTGVASLLGDKANNWLYLNGHPVDDNGIALQLSSAIQLPGLAPSITGNFLRLAADSSVTEGLILPPCTYCSDDVYSPSGLIDPVSTAVVSNIPGFTSVTIGTGTLNAVTADYSSCTAAITIQNGLANRPSSNIGATSLVYRYTFSLTDGSFTTTADMLITCSSASPQQDSLGSYYQTVVSMNGTRTYQDGDFSVTSYIVRPYLWPTDSPHYSPNRLYPFSYSSSPPRTYAVATTPFLDVSGIQFVIEPPVPEDDNLSYDFNQLTQFAFGAADFLNSACHYSTPTTLSSWAVGSGVYFTTELAQETITNLSQDPHVLLARNAASPYNFTGCGLSVDGTTIWLLDANRNTLYASDSSHITLTTAATFAQEPLSFSPALVVDPTNLVAYVAFASGHLYAVPLNPAASTYGQSYNTPTATYSQPITALTLDSTATTLYFGLSKTAAAPAAIRSVAVSAGTVSPLSGSTLLYSGGLLVTPSSLSLSPFREELYITDGGETYGASADAGSDGYVDSDALLTQYIFALDFLNLTHLAVELRASDVHRSIRGGVYADPSALTDGSFYTSLLAFATPKAMFGLSAFSVASISQTASQLSFGLTDALFNTKPLLPQLQQQLLSFVD